MTTEEIVLVAGKVAAGTASVAELAAYLAYCEALQRDVVGWEGMEAELPAMKAKSLNALQQSLMGVPVKRVVVPFVRWAVAAAAVAAVVFGVWFYSSSSYQDTGIKTSSTVAVSDIKPGRNTATLTLASGKQIVLSDALKGELAEEAGVKITKAAKGQLVYELAKSSPSAGGAGSNTLRTARGETYQVILPDKSHVWLNAASSITYPASFAGSKERRITLTGEAYFEVSKNKMQPFVVSTKNQDVLVLGTHFNINSYGEEGVVKTTLLEGSVRVNLMGSTDKSFRTLLPGQQSVLSDDGLIKIASVDAEDAVDWKNGTFVFNSEPIPVIMRRIGRWYNAEIVYQGNVGNETFTGTLSRYSTVEEVLETLALTKGVKFKIEGRKIIVSK